MGTNCHKSCQITWILDAYRLLQYKSICSLEQFSYRQLLCRRIARRAPMSNRCVLHHHTASEGCLACIKGRNECLSFFSRNNQHCSKSVSRESSTDRRRRTSSNQVRRRAMDLSMRSLSCFKRLLPHATVAVEDGALSPCTRTCTKIVTAAFDRATPPCVGEAPVPFP
jgi:hypothetical protein